MSNYIPTFKPGDRVRIMQTVEMERRGLANLRGTVTDVSMNGDDAMVLLDKSSVELLPLIEIPANSLMKEQT